MSLYINYGCGLCAPEEWLNFDASPTLRLQKLWLVQRKPNVVFPGNVRYGDIVKGLPVKDNSAKGIFCSHTLEHLSLQDCRTALTNTYKMLMNDGVFRCVVPDLEVMAREYIKAVDSGNSEASIKFIGNNTMMGTENRPKGLKGLLTLLLGNSRHLWMWDRLSLREELIKAGFINIRECHFGDSADKMFSLVEDAGRFIKAIAMEGRK